MLQERYRNAAAAASVEELRQVPGEPQPDQIREEPRDGAGSDPSSSLRDLN